MKSLLDNNGLYPKKISIKRSYLSFVKGFNVIDRLHLFTKAGGNSGINWITFADLRHEGSVMFD